MKILLALLLLWSASNAQAVLFTDVVGAHYGGDVSTWTKHHRKPSDVDASIKSELSYEDNLAEFTATLPNAAKYETVVLQVFGGREYANVERFIAAIDLDGGAGLRNHMRLKAVATKGMANVYWQLGNEINAEVLSTSLHTYKADGIIGADNDVTMIPIYAEYWAAALAGLLKGDPNAKIILGSVANAAGTDEIVFIEALLNYTIVGTYAPSLAGKKFSDLIKIGSIHYSQNSGGRDKPVALFTKYGMEVWHTEEVGQRAAEECGMCKALPAIFRTMGEPGGLGMVYLWGTTVGAHKIDTWMPVAAYAMSFGELTPTTAFATGTDLVADYYIMPNGYRVAYIYSGTLQSLDAPKGGLIMTFSATGPLFYGAGGELDITASIENAVLLLLY